jgi:rSAM/selenodomain-associated transferase 2/rSAM/selenodomain-associated transferase 1
VAGPAPGGRISIIVPARNEAPSIGATLAALAPLRARGHEVIVVDAGSDDDTRSIAAPLADRVLVARRGRARQMNAGALAAGGGVLLFLHADTRLPADADASMLRALRAGHRWGRFDIAIDGASAWLPIVGWAMNLRSRATGVATGDQAVFVRRERFDAAGGFPDVPMMEDVALSKRLLETAGRPACLRDVARTSGRRWDTHGALRTIALMWRLRFDFWRGADTVALAERYGWRTLPTLQIFAREPRAGTVKTRLAATIGATRARDVHAMLVTRTLAAAVGARAAGVVGDVELWCTPSASAPVFREWRDRYGVVLATQCAGDLGARMRGALQSALARGVAALLVGTDCPGLDAAYLREAAAALATHDAVIGPAEDGGYVLIGLARDADVFSGIRYGTPTVYAATRARAAELGLRVRELPLRFDVDTAEDLARLTSRVR